MTQKFETKAEWHMYYSENSEQRRWVYIDKDVAKALLYSMKTLQHYFMDIYDVLLNFDAQERLEDIGSASIILRKLISDVFCDGWYIVDYNTAFMFRDALVYTKRAIKDLPDNFTLRSLRVKIEKAICIFDIKWWDKEIEHPEELPDCIKVDYKQIEKDPCNTGNVKVFLEGRRDDKSEWVEIKGFELEPGMTANVTKEIGECVGMFNEFRFVRKRDF